MAAVSSWRVTPRSCLRVTRFEGSTSGRGQVLPARKRADTVDLRGEDLHDAAELHADAIVIAAHTDICPDVAKRRAAGERQVMAARHLPTLRAGGVTAVCDHV